MPSFLLPQGINGAENPANSFNRSLGGLKNHPEEYFCRSWTSVDEYDKSHDRVVHNRWLTIKPLDLKPKGQRAARSLFPLNLLTAALSFIRARGRTQATLCLSGDGLILTAAAGPTAPQRKDGNRIWPPNLGSHRGFLCLTRDPSPAIMMKANLWRRKIVPDTFNFYVTGIFPSPLFPQVTESLMLYLRNLSRS